MKTFSRFLLVVVVTIIATFLITKKIGENSEKTKADANERLKLSLINTDKDFYKASLINGTGRAFIDFADTDVVLLRQNKFPLTGKKALEQSYMNDDTSRTPLKWEPVKAEVSPDGKLGYTFGTWEYNTIDKTGKAISSYGNYVTIWRKQKDGTWKYVLDGGSNTPPPGDEKD